MGKLIENIFDVVDYQLCCGCGACAYRMPDMIAMEDQPMYGRRPIGNREQIRKDSRFNELLDICPGIGLRQAPIPMDNSMRELHVHWGPVYELWTGSAVEKDVRFAGSSGGVISALALYGIEQK